MKPICYCDVIQCFVLKNSLKNVGGLEEEVSPLRSMRTSGREAVKGAEPCESPGCDLTREHFL